MNPRRVGGEFSRGAGINDVAVIEHIRMVGNLKADADVLLDEQHGNALCAHLRHDAEDLPRNERRQSLRRLIENKEFGIDEERTGN